MENLSRVQRSYINRLYRSLLNSASTLLRSPDGTRRVSNANSLLDSSSGCAFYIQLTELAQTYLWACSLLLCPTQAARHWSVMSLPLFLGPFFIHLHRHYLPTYPKNPDIRTLEADSQHHDPGMACIRPKHTQNIHQGLHFLLRRRRRDA